MISAAQDNSEKEEGSKMKLDKKFLAKLQKSFQKGGWTYVVWPSSVKFFGTRPGKRNPG
jgi:hypothetical protein